VLTKTLALELVKKAIKINPVSIKIIFLDLLGVSVSGSE